MENYEAQLLSVNSDMLPAPVASIPYGNLVGLSSIEDNISYEKSIRALSQSLPFEVKSWPSFGEYTEDWFKVEVGQFKRHLYYCERGSCDLRESCTNLIDLSFQLFRIIAPAFTSSASTIVESLDRIEDQRIIIWFRMSSEIFHMYQVNQYFGLRMATENMTWMCQELVRMGVFANPSDAFKSKAHMIKGLMLSGMSNEYAEHLYSELQNA